MENLGRLTAPKCRGPTFASKTLQAEKPRRAQEATTITIRGTPQAPIHGGGPSDGRTWRGVLRTPLLPCSATPSLSDRARSQRKKKLSTCTSCKVPTSAETCRKGPTSQNPEFRVGDSERHRTPKPPRNYEPAGEPLAVGLPFVGPPFGAVATRASAAAELAPGTAAVHDPRRAQGRTVRDRDRLAPSAPRSRPS